MFDDCTIKPHHKLWYKKYKYSIRTLLYIPDVTKSIDKWNHRNKWLTQMISEDRLSNVVTANHSTNLVRSDGRGMFYSNDVDQIRLIADFMIHEQKLIPEVGISKLDAPE